MVQLRVRVRLLRLLLKILGIPIQIQAPCIVHGPVWSKHQLGGKRLRNFSLINQHPISFGRSETGINSFVFRWILPIYSWKLRPIMFLLLGNSWSTWETSFFNKRLPSKGGILHSGRSRHWNCCIATSRTESLFLSVALLMKEQSVKENIAKELKQTWNPKEVRWAWQDSYQETSTFK